MNTQKTLRPIIRIAKYTLADEVRQRSFVVMFVMCVIFVFLTRGCYQGNYMVNGQALDAGAIVGAVSKVIFHLIAVAVMLLAALLSMRVFRRDRDEGVQSSILSKPITRRQYVMGKILGLWALSTCFMFILHAILFLIVSVTLKEVMPGYLAASLLCSFNLLFVVVAVLLLSLLMPDIVAFLCVVGIGVAGSDNRLGICVKPQPDGDCDDPAIDLLVGGGCPLRMAKTFRGATFCVRVHRQRGISRIRLHVSSHQCASLLPYCQRVTVQAFQK